jgi:hypothetical protein
MSDPLGLTEGVKGLSSGLDSAREAGKSVSKQIENMERKNNEEYQHDLKAVRRVQFYCFVAALVVTLWLKFILRAF